MKTSFMSWRVLKQGININCLIIKSGNDQSNTKIQTASAQN